MIVITRREHIASIRGKAIYAVRDVTLIPLASQEEAQKTIDNARTGLTKAAGVASGVETDYSEVEDEADTASVASIDEGKDAEPMKEPLEKSTTSTKDDDQNQGKGYGSFAKRWFGRGGSKKGPKKQESEEGESKPEQGPEQTKQPQEAPSASSTADSEQTQQDPSAPSNAAEEPQEKEAESAANEQTKEDAKGRSSIASLKPRILRTARMYFSSTGFFFSYDHDLSHSLTQHSALPPDSPLWKRFNETVRLYRS